MRCCDKLTRERGGGREGGSEKEGKGEGGRGKGRERETEKERQRERLASTLHIVLMQDAEHSEWHYRLQFDEPDTWSLKYNLLYQVNFQRYHQFNQVLRFA